MTTLFNNPQKVFDMVVLVEPPLWTPQVEDKMTDMYRFVEKATPSRKSTWRSKQAAYDWFRARSPWSTWDLRVLKIYVVMSIDRYNYINSFIN